MYKLPDHTLHAPKSPSPFRQRAHSVSPTIHGGTSHQAPVVTLAEVEDVKEKQGHIAGTFQWAPFRKEGTASIAVQIDKVRRTSVVPQTAGPGTRRFVECHSEVMCVKFTPDGQFIAAGLANGTVKFFNSETGDLAYTLPYDSVTNKKMPCTSITFPPATSSRKPEHGHIITATYACGQIRNWHYTSPIGSPPVQTIDEERQTLVGTYNPVTSYFLTAGADPHIHLYDINTRKRLRTFKASVSNVSLDGHRTRVFAIEYHRGNPHVFVSGGWDDIVHFWDDRQPHSMRRFYGPHICGEGLDIDPVHNHILTASWRKENALQIWDFDSGGLIKTLPRDMLHNDCLHYTGRWYEKKYILTGGCDKNMVRCIDRATLNTVGELSELDSAVYCIDMNEDLIIAGTGTRVWRVKHMRI